MGFYIQVPEDHDKAKQLEVEYGAEIIPQPASFSQIPKDKALIVVVDNGLFEAAGFAYDEQEFKEFTDPYDPRPQQFVLMDLQKAKELCGFKRDA